MYPRIPWKPFSHPLGFTEHTLETTRLVELGLIGVRGKSIFFSSKRLDQAKPSLYLKLQVPWFLKTLKTTHQMTQSLIQN